MIEDIKLHSLPKMARLILGGAAAIFLVSTPIHAQNYLSGTFDCQTVEVDGKSSPCKAPSLELKSDGSYEMLSEKGSYQINGNWLVLSSSKKGGKARLDSDSKKIIFEFFSGGKKSRVTYQREFEREPGQVVT
jgi:hypothetical protein